jgi:hypothetical protein
VPADAKEAFRSNVSAGGKAGSREGRGLECTQHSTAVCIYHNPL